MREASEEQTTTNGRKPSGQPGERDGARARGDGVPPRATMPAHGRN